MLDAMVERLINQSLALGDFRLDGGAGAHGNLHGEDAIDLGVLTSIFKDLFGVLEESVAVVEVALDNLDVWVPLGELFG